MFTTSSVVPSLRLQATRSLSVLLKPCLAGEGVVNPALSQSPAAGPVGVGLGLQSPWSLCWSRGPFFLKQSPYRLFFQCPLYFWVSYFHKRWGTVGCLLCSSVDRLGVSPMCRGKWTLLPPISLPSSVSLFLSFLRFYLFIFRERGK